RLLIGDYEVQPLAGDPVAEINWIKEYKEAARGVDDIRAEARDNLRNARIVDIVLKLRQARYKPYGMLRTMPWYEDRGPNPYLTVTGNLRPGEAGVSRYLPWDRGQFTSWLVGTQLPVLLEP